MNGMRVRMQGYAVAWEWVCRAGMQCSNQWEEYAGEVLRSMQGMQPDTHHRCAGGVRMQGLCRPSGSLILTACFIEPICVGHAILVVTLPTPTKSPRNRMCIRLARMPKLHSVVCPKRHVCFGAKVI